MDSMQTFSCDVHKSCVDSDLCDHATPEHSTLHSHSVSEHAARVSGDRRQHIATESKYSPTFIAAARVWTRSPLSPSRSRVPAVRCSPFAQAVVRGPESQETAVDAALLCVVNWALC